MLVDPIILECAAELEDAAYGHWTKDELIGYLSDGQREVAIHRPDAVSETKSVLLAPGTAQAIPSDGRRFLKIIRNEGDDGVTPGDIVTNAEMEALDREDRGWHSAAEATKIDHYLFDDLDPKGYYVYPPGKSTVPFRIVADAPSDVPAGSVKSIKITPDGNHIIVSHTTSPYFTTYEFENGLIGVKLADPAAPPTGTVVSFDISPDGSYIVAAVTGGAPHIAAYPLTNGVIGAKLSDPASPPPAQVHQVVFSPTGGHVACVHNTTPFITTYVWAAGFGAAIADPSDLPPGTGRGVEFSPDGLFLAVAHELSPYAIVWPWTGAYGSKVADPSESIGAHGESITFAGDGTSIAFGMTSAPYIAAYAWSAGFGAKAADPSDPPTGKVNELDFSPDGTLIAAATNIYPFYALYPWSGAFGEKYSDPAMIPTQVGADVYFSPTGASLFISSDSSPYIIHFKNNLYVRLQYAREPVDVPLSTDTPAYAAATDVIDLADIYKNALLNYMLHRAHRKDTEAASMQKSAMYHGLFMANLGIKLKADASVAPETG